MQHGPTREPATRPARETTGVTSEHPWKYLSGPLGFLAANSLKFSESDIELVSGLEVSPATVTVATIAPVGVAKSRSI